MFTTYPSRRWVAKLCAVSGVLFLSACSSPDWQTRSLPTEQAVSASLELKPDPVSLREYHPHSFSLPRIPQAIRPCCAFGTQQKVKVGSLPVPWFRLSNTVSLEEIGPHAYEAGTFSRSQGEPYGPKGGENNGMLYTLKGGFIDLAHVRDTTDNTVALFKRIHPRLGEEFTIELPDEIGKREIRFSAFELNGLSQQQILELSANLAARMAYSMAEAHEIAQWHGYRTWVPWSEEVSAYSPEDIYSNMLGAKIGVALILNNLVMNLESYNQHMTSWLNAALMQLEPVSKEQTNALFSAIDGHWWDSSVTMPDKFMLLKRHYEFGKSQSPHLVPKMLAKQDPNWPQLASLFAEEPSPLTLALPSELHKQNLSELAEQWLFVGAKYEKSFSHIPESLWREGFSNKHFRLISHYNQRQDQRELQAHLEQRGDK